jgi:hypothetical protein
VRANAGIWHAGRKERDDVRHGPWLHEVLADIRYARRVLGRNRAFTAVVVVTLALGVGANVAISSVVDAVLLRALPFRDPDRLVRVFDDLRGAGAQDVGMSAPELQDLRARSDVFDQTSWCWGSSLGLR